MRSSIQGGPTRSNMSVDDTSNMPNTCQAALKAIAVRDFRTWHGLPQDCSYAEFDARFARMSDGHAVGNLGRTARMVSYRTHVVSGYKTGVHAWFEDDIIQLIELNFPSLPHPSSELSRSLGPAAAKIDYNLDIAVIPGGAWIYPNRGIALFVDGPLGEVMKIGVFHPCDLEYYLDSIHYDAEFEEL